MAISTEIVGKTFGPFVRDYTFKALRFALLVAVPARTAAWTWSTSTRATPRTRT